jgi:hypothetical protein
VRQQLGVAGELHGVFAAQPLGAFALPGNDQGGDLDDLAFTAGSRAGIALCSSDVFLGGHRVTARRGDQGEERLLDRSHRRRCANERFASGAPVCWLSGWMVGRVMRSLCAEGLT